jgi:hypothetical protein
MVRERKQDKAHRLALLRSDRDLIEVKLRVAAPEREGEAQRYTVERSPMGDRALRVAWTRLAAAGRNDPSILADVLWVLASTVPVARRAPPPPAIQPTASRTWTATAAHPRAFKGTKHKPVRAERGSVADLRPHLLAPGNTQAVLTLLWPTRALAGRRWRELGGPADAFRRMTRGAAPPPDVYVFVHHPDAKRPALAPAFAERILPSLAGASWDVVRRAATLHSKIAIRDDLSGLLVARILQLAPSNRGLSWWRALGFQPAERHLEFLTAVLESRGWEADADRLSSDLWGDLGHRVPTAEYAERTRAVVRALVHGVNPVYLAAGVRLAIEHEPECSFPTVRNAPDFSPRTFALIEELKPAEWGSWNVLGLWAAMGAVPGLSSTFERVQWRNLDAIRKEALLHFLKDLRWHGDDDMKATCSREIEACCPQIERHLREVPDAYVAQFANDLGEILDSLRTPAQIRDRLPLAIDLLSRLNRPPLCTDGNLAWPIAHLLALPAPARSRVLAAPDASFHFLDRACRRKNAATLIARGLLSLRTVAPELLVEAFSGAPGTLCRAARELGVLAFAARNRLVQACTESPLFIASISSSDVQYIVAALSAAGREAAAIVPRALRDHLEGRRVLSAAQLERHRTALRRRLPEARLAAIRAVVAQRLAASVGLTQVRRDMHEVLALLQLAGENRRGLRRLLRARLAGDAGYLDRHPATRQWIRRHPRIEIATWTRGFEHRFRIGDSGVTIRLEDDPLEALKMGTYVGSCLGAGGVVSYSAAAAVLDINKQVLYARDDKERVLARQLVAITDDDRLVAFAVYPGSAPAAIRREFELYDRRLAAALGIRRVKPSEDYDVGLVLARNWWDDGAEKKIVLA